MNGSADFRKIGPATVADRPPNETMRDRFRQPPGSPAPMFDFDVQRCTRVCAATGEPIGPGDTFYSVLRWEAGQVVRLDYREQAWPGPPEDAIGWWQSVMPAPPSSGPQWAPDDVLLRYFEELAGHPEQAALRYVLALLLVRRKVLRLIDDETTADELALLAPPTETTYRVSVVRPSPDELGPLEQHLKQLLLAQGDESEPQEGTPHEAH